MRAPRPFRGPSARAAKCQSGTWFGRYSPCIGRVLAWCRQAGALPGVVHDSVVAERGGSKGQVHREFIVYDGLLVYPEFLVYVKP